MRPHFRSVGPSRCRPLLQTLWLIVLVLSLCLSSAGCAPLGSTGLDSRLGARRARTQGSTGFVSRRTLAFQHAEENVGWPLPLVQYLSGARANPAGTLPRACPPPSCQAGPCGSPLGLHMRAPALGMHSPDRSPCSQFLLFVFFFTLVTCPRRSLSLKLSDTRVSEPQIRLMISRRSDTRPASAGGGRAPSASGSRYPALTTGLASWPNRRTFCLLLLPPALTTGLAPPFGDLVRPRREQGLHHPS